MKLNLKAEILRDPHCDMASVCGKHSSLTWILSYTAVCRFESKVMTEKIYSLENIGVKEGGKV